MGKERIENAVTNIATNMVPGASKYVMTGYCIPMAAEGDGERSYLRRLQSDGCNTAKDFAKLWKVLRGDYGKVSPTIPDTATFEIYDSSKACGGTDTKWSDSSYFP